MEYDTKMTKTTLDPQEVIDQLRVIRDQLPAIAPMTAAQRKVIRDSGRLPEEIVHLSLGLIGESTTIAGALGREAEDVRELINERDRWTGPISELRALLNGIEGANLIRRHTIATVAWRAYMLALQLAKSPEHAHLLATIEEIKRLKSYARRKPKAAENEPGAESPEG
jgi:hypothetical protein